ncbi:class I SAM-dependent methyltransferase [Hungatella hathewayi]|uniref:class I SAM-dependent methyltransferase n=1 Tax=Hungatella hathewayi TaxID=154046 RepID=UPI0035645307
MNNPWEEIELEAYENHMKLDSIYQLQGMNEMMQGQFYAYPAKTLMILGIAGGNGLEHIDKSVFEKVYGVDINKKYLVACASRYQELQEILECVHSDLTDESLQLPTAELLVANLLIEYIGYEHFKKVVQKVKANYVSCMIQINTDTAFVSDSPYTHVFDGLSKVHHQMKEDELEEAMLSIGYSKIHQVDKELPNGKKLVRIDFTFR